MVVPEHISREPVVLIRTGGLLRSPQIRYYFTLYFHVEIPAVLLIKLCEDVENWNHLVYDEYVHKLIQIVSTHIFNGFKRTSNFIFPKMGNMEEITFSNILFYLLSTSNPGLKLTKLLRKSILTNLWPKGCKILIKYFIVQMNKWPIIREANIYYNRICPISRKLSIVMIHFNRILHPSQLFQLIFTEKTELLIM